MSDLELMEAAQTAMQHAYAPYSHFHVGAALLTESGRVYSGCNIENAAHTPTCCAERVAFFKALSEGETKFVSIAVVGGTDGVLNGPVPPCGVCRQVMAEFCDDRFCVLLREQDGTIQRISLRELSPCDFPTEIFDTTEAIL
jgi:cytidine deaminase